MYLFKKVNDLLVSRRIKYGPQAVLEVGGALARNRFIDARVIPVVGGTIPLSINDHSERIVLLGAAASTVVLPPATGSGAVYKVLVSATPTAASLVRVQNATDVMRGRVTSIVVGTGVATHFGALTASDTITFITTAAGGSVGDTATFTDIAAGFWQVEGTYYQTTSATLFSATV